MGNAVVRILIQRDQASEHNDLGAALDLDDQLEELGVHPDYRVTCHSCQSWAGEEHAHDALTGEPL